MIAATALAAAELWRLRTGRSQSVRVDLRAAVASFRSERYLRVDGHVPDDVRGPLFGFYRTGDGRFIQLHCAMPHHRDGIVRFLGCDSTREAMAAAAQKWNAEELEDALAATGMPVGTVRSPFGRLRHVVPAAQLSETPASWFRPAVPDGTLEAVWPA